MLMRLAGTAVRLSHVLELLGGLDQDVPFLLVAGYLMRCPAPFSCWRRVQAGQRQAIDTCVQCCVK